MPAGRAAVAVAAEHMGPDSRVGMHTAEHCSPIRTGCTPSRVAIVVSVVMWMLWWVRMRSSSESERDVRSCD